MVASISHDLRTPLNGLIGSLQSAKNSKYVSKEFYNEFLKPSLNCADYLMYLVNDILVYT